MSPAEPPLRFPHDRPLPERDPSPGGTATELDAIRRVAGRIRPLHEPKREPRPGDWLASHREPGQTFTAYLAAHPVRAVARYATVYVQPVGDFTATQHRIVGLTAQLLGRFYGVPARVLDGLPTSVVPQSARRVHPEWRNEQILTRYVCERILVPSRPADALALLALTPLDLWPGPGWNFVFGEASPDERVGVWSTYRYGNPEESADAYLLCLRRTLKVAVHETGHMLGLLHCTAYECGMNGSNHLLEMDARPMAFCPECAAKVWWACRVEPVGWLASLADFARQNALAGEAAFWRRSWQTARG